MKIVNLILEIKFFKIIFLFIALNPTDSLHIKQYQNNQKYAYPNTYEAPVSQEDVKNPKFGVPKLSLSLFEENPQRKIRMKDFLSAINYSLYKLTRGEIEVIFHFADMSKDDLIDQREWEAFTALFVFPFEACDDSGNYLLNEEEFKKCFDADPRSKSVDLGERFGDKNYTVLMEAISSRKENDINFSDYLIIRRGLFGWKECHSAQETISKNSFQCAIKSAIPIKYQIKINSDSIYNAGRKLGNIRENPELDFVSYIRTIYFSYIFSIYNLPNDSPFLEKTQFLKGVKEDRYPTHFSEKEVEFFYQMTNSNPFQVSHPMNIESFFFFFNFHRLFWKYSVSKGEQLGLKELNDLINDYLFPTDMRFAIDTSKANFEQKKYLEVSGVLQRLRLNERDFYYSFKQSENDDRNIKNIDLRSREEKKIQPKNETEVQNRNNNTLTWDKYYNYTAPDDETRIHFFYGMSTPDKDYWTKEVYYRTFLSVNIFIEFTRDQRFLVPINDLMEKLPSVYDSINPPVNMNQRENYLLWKNLPRDNHIDLLLFIFVENYKFKFNVHKLNKYEIINESLLKLIMKDYGWENIPDTVIDLAKKGYDQLRRRVFVVKEVMKYMSIVHSYALENDYSKKYFENFSISENKDITRKYPNFYRRHASSPLV